MARILVVEDDDEIRNILRMTLEDEGHTVDEAADGPSGQAAARMAEPPYDVIMQDDKLPGVSPAGGIRDAAHMLVEECIPSSLLAMSANVQPQTLGADSAVQSLHNQKRFAFLHKPFGGPEEILDTVDRLAEVARAAIEAAQQQTSDAGSSTE